ncbi:MAG: magnesium transporter [Gammaproteobacteria bacterium]|nr:MAG: magnesium transporter [Gammaproteobacteria bacterium]
MPQATRKTQSQTRLYQLNKALSSGTFLQIRQMLNGMPAAEVAHLIESAPLRERNLIWKLIDQEHEGDVLQYLSEDIRTYFLKNMQTDELVSAIEEMDTDDLADILQQLPQTITQQVIQSLDDQRRQRLQSILDYPEDSAGGLMNTDTITVRPNITLDVVLRYLRRHKELPPMMDNLLITSRQEEFVGLLPINKLLTSDPGMTVREAMSTDTEAIPATMKDRDVAILFETQDLVSAPVVDQDNKLLGRITIDDVVDVIREDADHSLMSMAGLDEDADIFAPIMLTSRKRAVWLGVNTLTAFIAAAVMGLFELTLDKVVALAILSPVVASMGGIAGSQTLTLVIRGMALGHVGFANARHLLYRETAVGILNGLFWSVIIGATASLWWGDLSIGLIIAAATTINLIVAAIAGATLPLILHRINVDPALAAGVLLTTITDVVGFTAFLGLATLVYL